MQDWIPYSPWPWQIVHLADGSSQRAGNLMRRKIDGAWQYRLPTEEENLDFYFARQY